MSPSSSCRRTGWSRLRATPDPCPGRRARAGARGRTLRRRVGLTGRRASGGGLTGRRSGAHPAAVIYHPLLQSSDGQRAIEDSQGPQDPLAPIGDPGNGRYATTETSPRRAAAAVRDEPAPSGSGSGDPSRDRHDRQRQRSEIASNGSGSGDPSRDRHDGQRQRRSEPRPLRAGQAQRPLEPKPPPARSDSDSCSSSTGSGSDTATITSCAIRSPARTVNGCAGRC